MIETVKPGRVRHGGGLLVQPDRNTRHGDIAFRIEHVVLIRILVNTTFQRRLGNHADAAVRILSQVFPIYDWSSDHEAKGVSVALTRVSGDQPLLPGQRESKSDQRNIGTL